MYYHRSVLPEIYRDYLIENNQIHKYNTRRHTDLHLLSVRCNIGQRCLNFGGSKFWNNVPQAIKTIESVFVFKKRLRVFCQLEILVLVECLLFFHSVVLFTH